jgi:hypothetical protein
VDGESQPLTLHLDDDYRETISFHRWFAMRRTNAARAAVAFTTSPEWLSEPDKFSLVATGDDAAIVAAIAEGKADRRLENVHPHRAAKEERLLDLCAGVGTVGAMAARLGFDAISVELSVVPHLIDRVLHEFAVSMAKPSSPTRSEPGEEHTTAWRGFAIEVENFANAVWRGAKERLKELFDTDVDIRLWVRIIMCPSCGKQVPLLPNARLSANMTLNMSPDLRHDSKSGFPRFALVQTERPDLKGTLARGTCTCLSCHNHFRLRGYDLIPLRSVPVAVRMRNSDALIPVESPGDYIRQVEAAALDSLAVSSRNMGNRTILSDEQSLFHDARGEPIDVRNALLPRQRAYLAALAESMDRESALLAGRADLTDGHRFAVRSAVALLISGQIDYVNTYTHWIADRPRPSTFAGPLRLGGLFAEVGGYWIERFWQNRLRRLLGLLQENSSAARPVRAIQADAAAIPLGDSTVSAVVWDPPYYDNVDYDAAGEPYQAILAAMVPDLVSELVVPPKLPRPERTERYERDLLQQANEARRVVNSHGSIGVFWLAREPTELQHFLEMVAPAGLQLLRAVRLDMIRALKVSYETGPRTYLLVLQPVPAAASAVVVDAEKVLALATAGVLSLYDGLAELLESVWDPIGLARMIPDEFRGSSRQRLVGFLASHPELEQLLVELGRMTLVRELVNHGVDADELHAIDARGLAQRLLAQLGFAVARPARFSIRAALRECEIVRNRLELSDSIESVRGSFLTGCRLIERILRYASFAWSHLACGNHWNEPLERIISSSTPGRSYPGLDKLNFGQYELLFTKLPTTFALDDSFGAELFSEISRILRKAKIHEKLSALVALRNAIEHDKEDVASFSLSQLRQRCCAVLSAACAALANIDSQHVLPLTVRPEEERRDRYGRRILRLLDPDGVAFEAYVGSETDLTEPLIYFASDSNRRDVDPKFLRASIVEELLGLT